MDVNDHQIEQWLTEIWDENVQNELLPTERQREIAGAYNGGLGDGINEIRLRLAKLKTDRAAIKPNQREWRCTCTRTVPSDELTTVRDPNCPWHSYRKDG